jgi:AcrR family transcriptional regulator
MEQTSALGRPRSEHARVAVLDAALRLARRDGYAAVTIKGIAEDAGVGRQTVYRWWTSKGAILLEAVSEIARRAALPEPTGDPERDLRELLRASFALTRDLGPVIAGLMADATHDPEFLGALQERLLVPRRKVVGDILERGRRAGRLGDAVDIALVTDMIWGTMWYRIQSRHAPVDARLADELAAAAMKLAGAGERQTARGRTAEE